LVRYEPGQVTLLERVGEAWRPDDRLGATNGAGGAPGAGRRAVVVVIAAKNEEPDQARNGAEREHAHDERDDQRRAAPSRRTLALARPKLGRAAGHGVPPGVGVA